MWPFIVKIERKYIRILIVYPMYTANCYRNLHTVIYSGLYSLPIHRKHMFKVFLEILKRSLRILWNYWRHIFSLLWAVFAVYIKHISDGVCGWRFEPVLQGSISSRFSRNSEASASELLENLEEMFPRYLYWITG